MLPDLNLMNWLISFFPILIILILMIKFQWSGGRAGAVSWILAVIIGLLFFGANTKLLSVASIKGLWNTLFVLYIIWGSMGIYNVVDKVGGFNSIANTFTKLTRGNRIIQLLVLGWAFPSFLQGVCGFGTPVAVAAPLLIGLQFNPIVATVAALLGHSWAVTFGSLGSSYGALLASTGLDAAGLALWSSIFLAISCVMVGIAICFAHNGLKGVREGWYLALSLSIVMGSVLYISANYITPYLASTIAGLVGLVFGGFALPRIYEAFNRKKETVQEIKAENEELNKKFEGIHFNIAFAPYYILVVLVLGVYLSPLKALLDKVKIGLSFPETVSSFGFTNAATASYAPIAILTTPGTLILLTIFLSIIFYGIIGLWKKGYSAGVINNVMTQAFPATITVMTMSMMAVIMMDAGLTVILAEGTAQATKALYPIFSPFIGILGAFMTGSNTSSNILFGAFQRDVAYILALNPLVIAALQTTGGALGNAVCPMNVALATAVTNITGQEGTVIKKTLTYVTPMAIVVGVIGLFLLTAN